MGKILVPKGRVQLTDKQVDNLGREKNPFSKGTYVVVPAQICSPKENPVKDTEYKFIPGLFAYILDHNKNVIDTKHISKAQFCKQTFGKGEIVARRVQNSNGNWFADILADKTNISMDPKFGFVIEDGVKNWALKQGFAVEVGDSFVHSTPILERTGDKWGYKKDSNNGELCQIRKVSLPDLTAVSLTATYPDAALPSEWSEFALGDKIVYLSANELEKEGE